MGQPVPALVNTKAVGVEPSRVTSLSEFRVAELVRAQPAQGAVQLQQLQGVAVQSPANQETREAGRQEEQGADVPHVIDAHSLYSQRRSREQAPDSEDLGHVGVRSALHLENKNAPECPSSHRYIYRRLKQFTYSVNSLMVQS